MNKPYENTTTVIDNNTGDITTETQGIRVFDVTKGTVISVRACDLRPRNNQYGQFSKTNQIGKNKPMVDVVNVSETTNRSNKVTQLLTQAKVAFLRIFKG